MPRVSSLRNTKKAFESGGSNAPRSSKWPPWHWPWWLVLLGLQIPLVGGAFVIGALSTMASEQRAVAKLKHTLILGNPHAVAAAGQAHGVWMVRVVLVALGVGVGVLLGRRFHRPTSVSSINPTTDDDVVSTRRKSPWLKEMLAAVLWAGTVVAVGYVVVRTGSHLNHLSFNNL